MTNRDGSVAPPARRTHAERRQETRAKLVAATIESLVEEGWSGTSTRAVAQRAGVSQGAQQHYFPTKRALVEAALEAILAEQNAAATTWDVPAAEEERVGFLLDRLWEIHCLPVNLAVQELLTMARTDPETAESIGRLHAEAERAAITAGHTLLPTLGTHPDFPARVRTSVATMRGIVAVAAVADPRESDLWPHARGVLLRGMPR
ncbi:TetR/AcrR family transcriptional regulator [Nocardioides antri]|uniref:TetR/AcrR family transcriptional regulator n=1 Tax=Nocardioides antri TaxID=2607659 RepID=A0A5B1M562_9ACTN|nr:TetR/AcrR family transcriptional regulator [Nocardioides antri]KAA1427874.1 TetR/AcrR family transcriptional regulator [Nocardioides antri]